MRIDREQWQQLSTLLDAALELAPEQRDAWLRELPDDTGVLRESLRTLLAQRAHVETDDFLKTPDFAAALRQETLRTQTPSPDLRPESEIGAYRLLKELGRGGMGAVWLAERVDGKLKRQIALKFPYAGPDQRQLAERLARERDILASLEHPNIARLYDADITAAGQPFLVLEYVDGTAVDVYCDRHRLSIRARLVLFLQVLRAVQYAHTHLVIHRDLKPSNILVRSDGVVQLLDFGIAKVISEGDAQDSALTQFGARALTPDYASPEQVSGQSVTTACDVYSLGVILYELMAGTRPYQLKRESRTSLEEAIAEADVTAPGRIVISADAAANRASTPHQLSRALRGDIDTIVLKALRKDPLERYSSVDHFSSDIERHLSGEPVLAHPSSLGYRAKKFFYRYRFAATATLAVAASLVVGTVAALWQAHLANLAGARAEQVKNFTLSILQGADTNSGAGKATTAVELLQAARERVASEYGGRPEIAAELKTTIAFGLIGHDRSTEAAPLLEEAIQLWMQTYGPSDARTIGAQVMYGEALYNLGKNAEALAVLKPAAHRAREADAHHAQIDAWRWLSSAQIEAGDLDGAIESARAAVTAIPRTSTADQQSLRDAMLAHLALANALSSAGGSGVVDEARAALALAAQINPPPQTIEARVLLGLGLVREGRAAEGLKEMQGAYAESRARLGDQHQQTEIIASIVGHACLEAGDAEGAVVVYRSAFDSLMQRPIERGPFALAMGHYGLGSALTAARDRERAEPLLREAVRLFDEAQGAQAVMTLRARSVHAMTLTLLGRREEAEQAFAHLSSLSFAGAELAAHNGRLAVHRSLQGRHEEAILLAKSSAKELQNHPSKTIRAQTLARLGSVLLDAARIEEAIATLESAVELYREAQPYISRDRTEAIASLERALAMRNLPPP